MTPRSRPRAAIVAAVLVAALGETVFAQEAPVTREEFNRMVKELTELRKEVTELRQQRQAAATRPATGEAASSSEIATLRQEVATLKRQREDDSKDSDERAAEIDRMLKDVIANARSHSLGETKLLITGDADVGFEAFRHSNSTFTAGFAPRFLWKLNDQLMFDAALDIGIGRDDNGNNATAVDLTIASVSYIVNDYITVGGGLFVAPFAAYHRNFDPSWINKLPDDPLVFSDGGLAPGSVLGAFVSGAVPIGTTKINYALYASNGPSLIVNDPDAAGGLDLLNASDLNNDKAFGGRIGFLPIPELEVGYSFLCGESAPGGVQHTHVFLQAFDVNYVKQFDQLLGTVTARAEWVFSHVNDTSFETLDGAGNPVTTTVNGNNRNGGYVMLAYRPNLVSNKFLRNTEYVIRYDRLDVPSNLPGGSHEQRYTIGIDYWFDARSVLKVAYECDDIANETGNRAIMVQFGMGF